MFRKVCNNDLKVSNAPEKMGNTLKKVSIREQKTVEMTRYKIL